MYLKQKMYLLFCVNNVIFNDQSRLLFVLKLCNISMINDRSKVKLEVQFHNVCYIIWYHNRRLHGVFHSFRITASVCRTRDYELSFLRAEEWFMSNRVGRPEHTSPHLTHHSGFTTSTLPSSCDVTGSCQ